MRYVLRSDRPIPQSPPQVPQPDGLVFVIVVIITVFMLAVAGLGFLFGDFLLPRVLGGR